MAANTHPLRTSVPDFVNGLRELERDLITKDRIAEYMAATTLRPEALHDYICGATASIPETSSIATNYSRL